MTQASQGTVIWAVVVATIVLLLANIFVVPTMIGSKIGELDVDVPTADEIATSVLAGVDIPTAQEIADKIDIPEGKDTIISVLDEQKELSIEAAIDELSDRDVREAIVDAINDDYDGCDDVDFDRHDITSIKIRDKEDSEFIYVGSNEDGWKAEVILELKVYFDNFGDEAESARVDVTFDITGLDRSEYYEDIKAVYSDSISDAYSCSTD